MCVYCHVFMSLCIQQDWGIFSNSFNENMTYNVASVDESRRMIQSVTEYDGTLVRSSVLYSAGVHLKYRCIDVLL